MKPIEDYDWRGRMRSTVKSVYMTKMYYFWSGRNAWNWSWSSRYPGIRAFHLALKDAKKEIQGRRVQGSTWTIREIPAVAFVADPITLVVAEINIDTPFERYTNCVEETIVLKTISDRLRPITPNSLVRFATETTPEPALLPFQRFKSYSYGGQYRLGWTKEKNSVELRYAYAVIQHVSQRVQKKAV